MYKLDNRKLSSYNKSVIVVPQTKGNTLNFFLSVTKQFRLNQIAAFLGGYVLGQFKINQIGNDNSKIVKKLYEAIELVKQNAIERKNIFQAVLETIFIIKKKQERSLQQSQKYNNKNKMMSQYESFIEQQNQLISQLFLSYFDCNLGQLMMDRNCIQNKWKQQISRQDQQRRNQQAIRKMMQQQEKQYNQKRKLQNKFTEQQDQKFIRKMMEQQKLKNKISQQKPLQCQICLVDIDYVDLGTLSCGHMFHRQCIFQHMKAAVTDNKVQINCPMEECKCIISIADIQEYLQGDILEKYNKFSLNKYVEMNNKDTSWCPTAGCSALFQFDQALDNYRCPACKKHYCLKCRCNYHYGMTCAQYRITNTYSKDDQNFQKFVRGAKFKQCPKCKFWVERVAGCSTMACRCGIEFCYDCGGTGCPHGSCTGSGKKK